MLYQFCNDYGLAEPTPSLASDYCDLVCSNNNQHSLHNSDKQHARSGGLTVATRRERDSISKAVKNSGSLLQADAEQILRSRSFSVRSKAINVKPKPSIAYSLVPASLQRQGGSTNNTFPSPKSNKSTEAVPKIISYPREITVKVNSQQYQLQADEIPNLTTLPAIGVNAKNGMKPFFDCEEKLSAADGILHSSPSPKTLSSSGVYSAFTLSMLLTF